MYELMSAALHITYLMGQETMVIMFCGIIGRIIWEYALLYWRML